MYSFNMSKRVFFKFLAAFITVFMFSAAVFADNLPVRPYFGVKGALSFVESDFDLGYYRGHHYHYYDNGYYYNDCYYYKHYDESGDVVFAGSAALGVKTKYLRAEFEYTRRTEASQEYSWFPGIKQEFDTFMLNGFFDFPLTPNIEPYIGLGFGMTRSKNKVEYDIHEETIFKNSFSLGIDLGISFIVARHFNIDCGFKLIYLGTVKIEDEDLNMYAADLYVGLRYTI